MKPNKVCKDCGATYSTAEGVKPPARCPACQRAWNASRARRLRMTYKKKMLEAGVKDGRKVCSKCYRNKLLSEFSGNRVDGTGRLNKLCDACLTRIYSCDSRKHEGFCPIFWRKRAYALNSAGRRTMAKQKDVHIDTIKYADLDIKVKPQDLAAVFEAQKGLCHFCKTTLTTENLQTDHSTPRSKGGCNNTHNFRMVCDDCNHLKWRRTEVEFLSFVQEYIKRFQVTEHPDKEPGVLHN